MTNCFDVWTEFKGKNKISTGCWFRDHFLKYLTSGFSCKFQFSLFNEFYYHECVRHLNKETYWYFAIIKIKTNSNKGSHWLQVSATKLPGD